MSIAKGVLLSVVVPAYNEAGNLAAFNTQLTKVLRGVTDDSYEIIYVDDGSSDETAGLVKEFCAKDKRVKLLSFSRNFGKEIATTAGINQAAGQAVMSIDADGQHPLALIPEFLAKWRSGAKVVIGRRTTNQKEGLIKRFGSKLFYKIFNRTTGMKILPGSTDFRLIDRSVQQEFARMTERSRITRGLIDWLGYDREYIDFKASPRTSGEAGYSFRKLFKLAIDSIISMTKSPLYISAYIGAVILPLSVLIGLFMIIDAILGDPLNLNATGSAYVVVLLLFLVGILLVSQGIIGLYLSHIHTETQNRPLYIIDKQKSVGLDES
jgi:polyisoprenyl-phosphate glycosyltransferase